MVYLACPSLQKFPSLQSPGKTPSISIFRISGQFLIWDNCHNSRISSDIDMKLGPVTKLHKKDSAMSKKN